MSLFVILKISVVKDKNILKFSDIQNIVLNMLKESNNWGSFHKHNCPSEICLLCYAILLWFNLANLIFEKYTKPEPVQCPDDEEEMIHATQRNSRPSFFVSECTEINTLKHPNRTNTKVHVKSTAKQR